MQYTKDDVRNIEELKVKAFMDQLTGKVIENAVDFFKVILCPIEYLTHPLLLLNLVLLKNL